MKKYILNKWLCSVASILMTMFSVSTLDAQLIREDRAWKYEVGNVNGADSESNPAYLTVRFADSELINGKEYHYLVGHTAASLYNSNGCDVTNCGVVQYGRVDFYAVPGERLSWLDEDGFYRLFLMREEDGKVYVYNDRTYQYTSPLKTDRFCFALDKQPAGLPDEFLVYDFNAGTGDEYETLFFDKDGIPHIAKAMVEEFNGDTATRKIMVDEETVGNDEVNPVTGSSSFFLAGLCQTEHDGKLIGIYNNRNEYVTDWFSSLNPEKDLNSVSTYQFEDVLVDTGAGTAITKYEIKPVEHINGFQYYRLCQTKYVYWNFMTQSWKIYDFHIPIADFRKENGVVYVKTYPDWKDDETGQPFPEGTELIYADMNVEEGDIFPTFSLSGYTRVIREDKKVKAITSALLPDNQIRDTLVFSDDDSKIDILERYLDGMRYIDGIGFIKVNCFGHLDFYTGQLNNVYDSEGNVIVKGMNRKIPDYVKVNEVGVGNAPDVIYTIEGLRVNRSLSDLPAGLYIVNGKKVAVTR